MIPLTRIVLGALAELGGEATAPQVRDWLAEDGEIVTRQQVLVSLNGLSRYRQPAVEVAVPGVRETWTPTVWRITEHGQKLAAAGS